MCAVRKARPAPASEPPQYPPGWFTAPARAWGVISPAMLELPADVLEQRKADAGAAAARDLATRTGKRCNGPATVLPGSAKTLPPTMMKRPRG